MAKNKMPLLSAQQFGQIAVLRIDTQHLVDDDTATRFYDEVIEAIVGCPDIVVDIAQVLHISSAGLAKFIQVWRQSQKTGGRVIFCRASPGVQEQFRTSRLDRLFQFASTLEDALAALSWSLAIGCPNAGCDGDCRSHEPSISNQGGELCCRSCGCRFWVAPFQLSPDGDALIAVSRFEIPTYEQEQIRAELGVIAHLQIVGRLDLFASEAVVDAWSSLPQPRRALLDLRAATEVSEAGLGLVGEQLRADVPGDRVVVLVDPDRSDGTRAGLSAIRVTTTQEGAMSILRGTLESGEKPAPLLVPA